MLLIFSPYPNKDNEKDGMIQRVSAIDKIFWNYERIYINASIKKNHKIKLNQINEKTKSIELNLFLHFFIIIRYIILADHIYVHSIYNAARCLPAYFLKKVTTDLHGVVPEELKLEGRWVQANIYSLIERIVIRRSAQLICVTNKMVNHFIKKYSVTPKNYIILPILPVFSPPNSIHATESPSRKYCIYSGGVQKWQNIELVAQAITRRNDIEKIILTNSPEKFKEIISEADTRRGETSNIKILSVPPNQVTPYYNASIFGFILRDPIIINEVACPTKLVEYMHHGVIPIILSEKIGDFDEYGYKFITIDEFNSGKKIDDNELETMRQKNYEIIRKMYLSAQKSINTIQKTISPSE